MQVHVSHARPPLPLPRTPSVRMCEAPGHRLHLVELVEGLVGDLLGQGAGVDFVGDEDTDVSIRLQMQGYRMGHGTGIAKRIDELDYHSAMRKFVKYGRGDARIIRKYPHKWAAILKHRSCHISIVLDDGQN